MELILTMKENKEPHLMPITIENVVQLDFCNMQELGDDVSDSGWNFISVITRNNGELKKQVIKLDNIWQFSLVRNKENE